MFFGLIHNFLNPFSPFVHTFPIPKWFGVMLLRTIHFPVCVRYINRIPNINQNFYLQGELMKEIKRFQRMQIDLKSNLDRLQWRLDCESKVSNNLIIKLKAQGFQYFCKVAFPISEKNNNSAFYQCSSISDLSQCYGSIPQNANGFILFKEFEWESVPPWSVVLVFVLNIIQYREDLLIIIKPSYTIPTESKWWNSTKH